MAGYWNVRSKIVVAVAVGVAVVLADGAAAGAAVCANASARTGPSASLPDCRVYELVSPPNGEDGEVYIPRTGVFEPTAIATELPFQAAVDGNAVAYAGDPSPTGNGSIGRGGGNEYLATRLPAGGWRAEDLQPPGYKTPLYLGFSADLRVAVLDSEDGAELTGTEAPAGGYSVPYRRTSGSGAVVALVTSTPPGRVPSLLANMNNFGTAHAPEFPEPILYAGANTGTSAVPEFEDILFEANAALVAEAAESGAEANDLYEWQGGHLRVVNVLPAGSLEPPNANAVFGAARVVSHEFPNVSHVISADGKRVFWTDLENGRIYVRIDGTITQPVSAGAATYWTATADGRYAYYTEGETLWRYDVETATRQTVAGAGAEVQGVVAVNEEGEAGAYLYFVANGQLAVGASAHEPNLYVQHGGAIKFIATLSAEDDNNGAAGAEVHAGDWRQALEARTAQATPDGRYLAFMSDRSLTGYANNGLSEVYLYESEGENLRCVSCNPTGAPPSVTPVGAPNAAVLPTSQSATSLARAVAGNGGRVLFDSVEPLVSGDNNGLQDVYEWERNGEGSCQTGGGCVYLLSSGSSADISALIGASANGNDAFIATRAQLSPLDEGEYFMLYDARVDGVAPTPAGGCERGGCEREGAALPSFPTPPTTTFSDSESAPASATTPVSKPLTTAQKLAKALRSCRTKRDTRKRLSCERGARKRYPTQKSARRQTVRRGA
jgi:hypothetical protein